jgi:hypothetical protein
MQPDTGGLGRFFQRALFEHGRQSPVASTG